MMMCSTCKVLVDIAAVGPVDQLIPATTSLTHRSLGTCIVVEQSFQPVLWRSEDCEAGEGAAGPEHVQGGSQGQRHQAGLVDFQEDVSRPELPAFPGWLQREHLEKKNKSSHVGLTRTSRRVRPVTALGIKVQAIWDRDPGPSP